MADPSPAAPPTYADYVWECGRIGRWRDSMADRIFRESEDPGPIFARLQARHDALTDEAWAAFDAGLPLPRPDLPQGPPPRPVASGPAARPAARTSRTR